MDVRLLPVISIPVTNVGRSRLYRQPSCFYAYAVERPRFTIIEISIFSIFYFEEALRKKITIVSKRGLGYSDCRTQL